MLPPVLLQKGTLPPFAQSVGSIVLCRYDGSYVLCVKTFQDLIDLKLPGKYYGILQDKQRRIRFEIKKKIIAIDGEMVSYAVKCKAMNGLKRYLYSIAPHEGVLCSKPDAYIMTERGESIKAYAVRFSPDSGKDHFGVYLERGMMEDLPKGCPVYNRENQVIGLIKSKNYGILWFVKLFNESKLYECFEEYSAKKDYLQQYQSITNLPQLPVEDGDSSSYSEAVFNQPIPPKSITDLSELGGSNVADIECPYEFGEETVIESDTIKAEGSSEISNFAEPFTLSSYYQVPRAQAVAQKVGGCPSVQNVITVKLQLDAIRRQADDLSKKLEFIQSSVGAENGTYKDKVENPCYAPLYNSPSNGRRHVDDKKGNAGNGNENEFEDAGNYGDASNTTNDFSSKNIRIDGKLTKSTKNGTTENWEWHTSTEVSIENDYTRLGGGHMPIPQSRKFSKVHLAKEQRWKNFSGDTTINDIDQDALYELANELDDKEWERLAIELGVPEEIIKQIKVSQYGRSYVAMEFMQNFKTRYPRERVSDFRMKVEAIQRNDVVDFMDSALCEEMMSTFQEIPLQKLEALASRLEQSQFKSIKYWRHLAGLYGYENQTINAMESTFGYHERSPTVALFDYMGKSKPALSILEIGSTLEKLDLIRMSEKLHSIFSKRMKCRSLPTLVRREFSPI